MPELPHGGPRSWNRLHTGQNSHVRPKPWLWPRGWGEDWLVLEQGFEDRRYGRPGVAQSEIRAQLAPGPRASQLFFRLIDGEQPVGWLWLAVPFPGSDPTMAWVNYVQVDEEYRGRGYGKQVMLLAEEEAATGA